MTVYEFARKCMKDEEFNRGGVPKGERKCLDSIGFEYTVKDGCIQGFGEDLRKFYEAMQTLLDLETKYSKYIRRGGLPPLDSWRRMNTGRGDIMTRLKLVRETVGMSQSDLAKASGVNVRMIQHYEQRFKDINRASVMTVVKLADALGCEVRDLLELPEE